MLSSQFKKLNSDASLISTILAGEGSVSMDPFPFPPFGYPNDCYYNILDKNIVIRQKRKFRGLLIICHPGYNRFDLT